MSQNKPIQLGICCINTILRGQKPPVFASRKMIIRTVEEQGIDVLKEKIIQNLKDVLTMMDWNEQNGIKVFRLSSEMFPHKSNPKVVDYSFDFALDLLKQIGKKSKKYNQRLTFHPGQYNVIGTKRPEAFQHTINDLSYHADVLDLMRLSNDSVIVIHGGGIYGDKNETIERWCKQYNELPEKIKKRLVLENCEKCFSVEDCLKISKQVNIPVVFDTHHYECYCLLHIHEDYLKPDAYIPEILASWAKKGMKPKFHVSEQGSGRTGHHSDYIENIPDYLLEIPDKYSVNIDIMIEAKMKEQSIFRLYQKYPFLNCKIEKTEVKLEKYSNIIKIIKYIDGCECCEYRVKKRPKLDLSLLEQPYIAE